MRQIVLEAAPSFASLRDQLRAQPVRERVALLVQPDHELPNAGVLLVLLRRLADSEHLALGLVTENASLRRQALALGLPAFRDTRSAERQDHLWSRMKRREQVGLPLGESPRQQSSGYGQTVGKAPGPTR